MGLLDDLNTLAPRAGPPRVEKDPRRQKVASSSSAQPLASKKQRVQRRSPPPFSTQIKSQSGLRPNYSTWSLPELQDKARQYGFRPVKSRSVLEEQLYRVWDVLDNQTKTMELNDDPAEISLTSSSIASTLGDSTGGPSGSAMEGEIGDLTRQLLEELTSEEDESDEDDNDIDAPEEDQREETPEPSPITVPQTLSQQLHRAITSDADLYHRILLFEPISFDEISSTAKRAGVKGLRSKEALRTWLDRQGICHYSGELTGQRARW